MKKTIGIKTKKVVFLTFTILAIFLIMIISIISTRGSNLNPIAHWPMDDNSGSTIIKEIIQQNHASPMKSPLGSSQAPQPITGNVNGAINFIKFPGSGLTGAMVSNMAGPLAFIGSSDLTITSWVKFPPSLASNRKHYIINKYDSVNKKGFGFYIIRTNNNNNYLEFLWGDGSPSSPYTLQSNIPIMPNQWYLVTATFNKSQGTTNLYINNTPYGTYNNSSGSWGSLQNFIVINIGSQPSSIDEPIILDELMIFDRVLSLNEISEIYNSGTGTGTGPGTPKCVPAPCGLVAWYYMDGNANDFAPLGGFNNPLATNGISFVPGKVGLGVKFSIGGYIDIPASPALDNQEFTIDAWVKPEGPGPNNDFWGSVIVQKGLSLPLGHTHQSVSLWWSSQQNKFIFGIGDSNSPSNRVVSTNNFPMGQWYHVAATYDGNTMKLYVNGNLEGVSTLVTNITYDSSIPWTIGSTAANTRALGYPRTFNGIIDEVEIFERALSKREIQRIYNAGSAGKCKMKKIELELPSTQ